MILNGKKLLAELFYAEIADLIKEYGEKPFRSSQVQQAVNKGIDPENMLSLPSDFRSRLAADYIVSGVRIDKAFTSALDGTEKYLYTLYDGNVIEGVLMKYKYGNTLCVSTQVGCRMGCLFCASTLEGCVRNLSAGEMLGQVIAANDRLSVQNSEQRVHNIVLMGSGEPLDNYDEVVRFLRLVNQREGLNISVRNISLSTCGIVPKIYTLADEGLPVTLCISLHAPNDAVRKQIMPVANAYSIPDIIKACRNYIRKMGRRVVFEYALIDGVNCSPSDAVELASLLRGMQCHVNVIPLNSVKERSLNTPSETITNRFIDVLKKEHISVTRRREMGDDIQGACGQLRRSHVGEVAGK
ncbi:MAG: 23S rRNA (adenine(2503)-C(2))-methyltransferase RlmN [Clostridiales bacterium]|nr:23S rRNA (adenine(2503)-C(2))-methyltransferase RlmN [Clostridiales bacterium]